MIRFALQIFTFIFALTLEVRVHAAEVVSLRDDRAPLEEPANCLDEGDVCAVKTNNAKKLRLEVGNASLTLGSSTAVIRNRKDRITLVSGTVLLKVEDQFFVETEFGKVIVNHGEVILVKEAKKFIARVNSGEVFIQPRGQNSMSQVKPGQENFMSAVDSTGVAHTGIETVINFNDHALIWSSLYAGKKQDFQKELKSFAHVWREASQNSVALHSDLAKRRIASLEQDYQKRQKELKKRQAYESQLRSLFRRKSLDQ